MELGIVEQIKDWVGRKTRTTARTKTFLTVLKKIEINSDNNFFVGSRLFNVIMFDVDSKDASVGMSSPPRPFVNPKFLTTVKQCLCHSHGEFF